MNRFVSSKGSAPDSPSRPRTRFVWTYGGYRRIRLTWSDTSLTFSMPVFRPVIDLLPRSYQDSIPGSTALNPFRLSRLRWGSESSDRLLSAMKVMLPGGTASSITSRNRSNLTPKFGSCHPTRGRLTFRAMKRRSSRSCLLYTSDAADDLLCVDL